MGASRILGANDYLGLDADVDRRLEAEIGDVALRRGAVGESGLGGLPFLEPTLGYQGLTDVLGDERGRRQRLARGSRFSYRPLRVTPSCAYLE